MVRCALRHWDHSLCEKSPAEDLMHSRVQFNLKSPFWTVRATAILPTQGRFGELPLLAVSSLAAPSLWANCLAGRLSCGSFGSNESFGPSPKDFQRVYTRYIHETDTCCFDQSCCVVSVGFHPYRNRSQGRRPCTSMPYSKLYFLRCTLLQSDNLNAREALCFFHAEIPASGASSVLEQSV